jgi:hypothetical protein
MKICENEGRWKERCRVTLNASARVGASDGRNDGSCPNPDNQHHTIDVDLQSTHTKTLIGWSTISD